MMKHARHDIQLRRTEIEGWIAEGKPKAFICRQLKCKPETLEAHLKEMNISYVGNQGGWRQKTSFHRVPAQTHMFKGSLVGSHILKLKMIRDGLRKHECQTCCLSEWNGVPIPLELHHIDGDRFNNLDENLLLLCPNCHALMPNNSGKATKSTGNSKRYKRNHAGMA